MRRTIAPFLFVVGSLASTAALAGPARLVVDNYPCFLEIPCPAVLPPRTPPIVLPGQTFDFFAAAFDASGSFDSGFRGTVRFTSSDPLAVLPPDWTFNGANGASLKGSLSTLGSQTITATDISSTHLPGSFQWRVTNQIGTIPTTSKRVELFLALTLAAAAWTVLRRTSA